MISSFNNRQDRSFIIRELNKKPFLPV
ncbi:hypothetical protein CP8484711_1280A, partial [Chlamydia psittaci 84-8471/1]